MISLLELFQARKHLLAQLKAQGYLTEKYEGFVLNKEDNVNSISIEEMKNQLDMLIVRNEPTKKRVFVKFHQMPKPLHPEELQLYVNELFSPEESATRGLEAGASGLEAGASGLEAGASGAEAESSEIFAQKSPVLEEAKEALHFTPKDDFIMVVQNEPSESLQKKIIKIWRQDQIYVNVIALQRLQFDVTKHSMVPPHKVLQNEARDEMLKRFLNGVSPTDHVRLQQLLPEISVFDPVAQAIGMRPHEICEITRPSPTALTTTYYRFCVLPF